MVQIWNVTAGHEAIHATQLWPRLFAVYLSTKSYFPRVSPGLELAQMQKHREQILMAIGLSVDHMYDLRAALGPLEDQQAYVLRFLIHCFQGRLASHLKGEYTYEIHASWDKFLTSVAVVLKRNITEEA